jgi:hypothetical protein
MGGLSIWDLIVLAFVASILIIPFAKIMSRAGWSGWMALLFPIPIVGVILLWSFAFSRWPALDDKAE